ncbi:T9SS type A sorting domain-containing protein [Winogradskyella eckloniae]|uniref:T9SS type A sorting domain-containing protein n=1 Tax=Winogradskyella eckloniae TaxID=1089306 RepID=UPI0015677F77|nr:T9SS type A sorting domain-containing protein [Winogradskyella eckloniae]NRD21470.1 T9SS type A sorting domain-containing protein [Winogradskyella eckloniae]
MKLHLLIFFSVFFFTNYAQDLSQGYIANDLATHAMQPLDKPDYLSGVTDPSFPSTTIVRISDAAPGGYITPMYSTIQAWNANESLLILYSNANGHQLLNGTDYTLIRNLTDVSPDDIETIIWHFTNPELLYYHENSTDDFIEYNAVTQTKTTLFNFNTISGCNEGISLGNNIQMMSWDSDVVGFRCGNSSVYYYRISTSTLTEFNISDVAYTAPMPFPSGNLFFHQGNVYDINGDFVRSFNVSGLEHSCLGKLSNGDDAYFAIGFEVGPNGGCQGTLVAHNATNGNCFPVTPTSDYGYPQSGTHISSLAHKNTEGGWVAVSMMGYDLDGQDLLDQELFIAKVNENDANVYRVAHHRSDEEDVDYFGEPHVTISPSGTRLLFGSDWSGVEDGVSVDSYVAELNAYTLSQSNYSYESVSIYPNPVNDELSIKPSHFILNSYRIYNILGEDILSSDSVLDNAINVENLRRGIYFIQLNTQNENQVLLKFIKQ